jgi:hypothetical protein
MRRSIDRQISLRIAGQNSRRRSGEERLRRRSTKSGDLDNEQVEQSDGCCIVQSGLAVSQRDLKRIAAGNDPKTDPVSDIAEVPHERRRTPQRHPLVDRNLET